MLPDDHYIPNERNAHIGTSDFEKTILDYFERNPAVTDEELLEHIYGEVFSKTAVEPTEPGEDALICRYFSPAKFIQFLHTRRLAFPTANQFTDRWECVVPEDYNNAVLRILEIINRSGLLWAAHVKAQASSWNISCWTELKNYFDHHLMWAVYAEGNHGIGVTIRYGRLKAHLAGTAKELDLDGQLRSGRVNYKGISLLPYNKHFMFRNENEVRFAFRSHNSALTSVSVEEIFSDFGIRISPAAETEHAEAIREIWIKHGGEDRIQHPR